MEKLGVDQIGPFVIIRKGQKQNFNLKAVAMIDHVTGCLNLIQYDDRKVISIANLVETKWLSRYLRPMKITNDQG